MTDVLGIIPAGGLAERFQGVDKELLPISRTDCGLTRCIQTMQLGGANDILLFTNRKKLMNHWNRIKDLQGVRMYAQELRGLWEVIAEAGKTIAKWYYFAMPDTVFPLNTFMHDKADVLAGTFITNSPERFGVFHGNVIVDKRPDDGIFTAWGVWIWSEKSMRTLIKTCLETHDLTQALNTIIGSELKTFPLAYYHDFASFEDYKDFICHSPI